MPTPAATARLFYWVKEMIATIRAHFARHRVFYSSIRTPAVLILLLIAALTAELYL